MKIGSKHSIQTKQKISKSRKGLCVGNKNHKWKGNDVGYIALHDWIKVYYGRASLCENKLCADISKTYDWANISGKYKRKISDWKQLCRSCHKKFDWKPKKYCINRHKIDGNNLWINNRGNRVCKKCKAIRAKKDYEKDKQKVIDRVNKWRKNKKIRTTLNNLNQ